MGLVPGSHLPPPLAASLFAQTNPQLPHDLLQLFVLAHDPQTSGGLLVAVAPEFGNEALAVLDHHGVAARRIGVAIPKGKPLISVQ